MDKTKLVDSDIVEAWRVVSTIEKAGLPVFAAVAVRSRFPNSTRIVIASPDVERHGPSAVIRFVDRALSELHSPFRLADTYIVNHKDKVAKQVADYFGDKSAYHFGTSKNPPYTLRIDSDDDVREGVILMYKARAKSSPYEPRVDEAVLTSLRAA